MSPGNVEVSGAARNSGDLDALLTEASGLETPPTPLCLKLARGYQRLGEDERALRWLRAVVDAGEDAPAWLSAAGILRGLDKKQCLRRSARVAVLGAYTTAQLVACLELVAASQGVDLQVYEADFGQYEQEILDPGSGLYRFNPEFVLLAVSEREARLPEFSESPGEAVEAEVRRWMSLWRTLAARSDARIVQHNFALPVEAPMGHLGTTLPGCRYRMLQALNLRLGEEAGRSSALIVDCDRIASWVGRDRWVDARYWYLAKQGVSLAGLPALARHSMAVMAAAMGLSRKCLVLDLDNTLWGGVIGEDGLAGIRLGDGAAGEAFVAFQEYILKLKQRGIILAVASKNNPADAREPFEKHPEMRLKLEDISTFVASWDPKPSQLRRIAETLNIGVDSLVFADDNPVERAAIRQFLPEVDVLKMPEDPTQYTATLASYLWFEATSFTPEDAARTDQYRARAQIRELELNAGSLEEFYRSLQMRAVVSPFDEVSLPRISQLIQKSNQFNLTTRRHSPARLREFMADQDAVTLSLRLRDCFSDHGLVSLLIATRTDDVLDIDTWLMSCRVIGRTVEAELLKHLCARAAELGCAALRGTYIPTPKNSMVKEIYPRFGFELQSEENGVTTWIYELTRKGPIQNEFIQVDEQ